MKLKVALTVNAVAVSVSAVAVSHGTPANEVTVSKCDSAAFERANKSACEKARRDLAVAAATSPTRPGTGVPSTAPSSAGTSALKNDASKR